MSEIVSTAVEDVSSVILEFQRYRTFVPKKKSYSLEICVSEDLLSNKKSGERLLAV